MDASDFQTVQRIRYWRLKNFAHLLRNSFASLAAKRTEVKTKTPNDSFNDPLSKTAFCDWSSWNPLLAHILSERPMEGSTSGLDCWDRTCYRILEQWRVQQIGNQFRANRNRSENDSYGIPVRNLKRKREFGRAILRENMKWTLKEGLADKMGYTVGGKARNCKMVDKTGIQLQIKYIILDN